MSENEVIKCEVCDTTMVPKKEGTTLDGERLLDGSMTLGDLVCPKCHPDLVDSK